MLTQEEMVYKIKTGNHDNLIPALWHSVRPLYDAKSRRYYLSHLNRCSRCGVDLDDLKQQSYFAFLKTIDEYDPESGLKFVNFINYPFKTAMQELLCCRTQQQRRDPLNNCDSLDKPFDTEDGSGDTLCEFVPDPTALDFLELLDAQSVSEIIHAEVNRLPERMRDVIAWHYFDGLTLGQIGERLALSLERVRQIKSEALRKLSKRRILIDLWNEYYRTNKFRSFESIAKRNNPEEFEAVHLCASKNAPKEPSALECAYLYAAEQRERSGKSPEEWTREDQIAAIVDYLQGRAAT